MSERYRIKTTNELLGQYEGLIDAARNVSSSRKRSKLIDAAVEQTTIALLFNIAASLEIVADKERRNV